MADNITAETFSFGTEHTSTIENTSFNEKNDEIHVLYTRVPVAKGSLVQSEINQGASQQSVVSDTDQSVTIPARALPIKDNSDKESCFTARDKSKPDSGYLEYTTGKVENDEIYVMFQRHPVARKSAVVSHSELESSQKGVADGISDNYHNAKKQKIGLESDRSIRLAHEENPSCFSAETRNNIVADQTDRLNNSEILVEESSRTKDAFSKYIESRVKSLQTDIKCEKGRKLQEAIEGNIKYFLTKLGSMEPLFQVSELIQVGSYAEGTKILKPDEFDFLAVVDALSKPGVVVLEKSCELPSGCVAVSPAEDSINISTSKLCDKGKLQCFHSTSLRESFRGPAKFGKAFVKAITMLSKEHPLKRRGMIMGTPVDIDFRSAGGIILPPVNGISVLLRHVEFKTPNVLLEFEYEGLEVGVDLSPALRYHKIEDCIKSETCACPKLLETIRRHGSVLLVGNKDNGFRISVTECEVFYMQSILKTKHKLLYIFFKYLCHLWRGITPFTSYMLKHICMYHDVKCVSNTDSLADCFGKIIEIMTAFSEAYELPSVVNTSVNLFHRSVGTLLKEWDLRDLFINALRVIHQNANEKATNDRFEAIVNFALNSSLEKFSWGTDI